MPSEKKQKSLLKSKDYKINGNLLRAFYDAQGKLVFVLDSTISEIKPNVLLVMTSRGNRKWDDVLANDYDMDLELVRPKKDNKYQKLDIEYDGLVVYDNLIRAYEDDGDVKKSLRELKDFREMSARRVASERLAAATAVAENARETIDRTGDTIIELQAKIKAVRTKIAGLRRNVGKEPTKQSAAKILRAEAQLDALTGKLERAKKRLDNANKRLLVAEDDIAAAQSVLDLVGGVDDNKKFKTVETSVPAKSVKQQSISSDEETEIEPGDDDVDDDEEDFGGSDIETDEYTDEEDDDNNDDIKPLFDKDPQIMDEKIAFKPISFDEMPKDDDVQTELSVKYDDTKYDDADKVESDDVEEKQSESKTEIPESVSEDKPVMSFEPPKPIMDVVSVPHESDNTDVVLDDVFAGLDDDDNDDEKTEPVTETDVVKEEKQALNVTPILETHDTDIVAMPSEEKSDADINVTPVIESETKEENMVVAPVAHDTENLVRPASPMAANNTPVANLPGVMEQQRKPSVLYYVLLLVLIALSVFTLWLYQRSNVSGDVLPTLVPDTVVEQTENVAEKENTGAMVSAQPEQVQEDENPFVASGEEIDTQESSTMEKIAEDSLNKIAEAADIPVEQTEPIAEEESREESYTDVVVNKPEYSVSQEKVFTNDVSGGSLCDGDVAPDTNGCCPGETYSVVNGQNVCCPDDGGDCFPPMF